MAGGRLLLKRSESTANFPRVAPFAAAGAMYGLLVTLMIGSGPLETSPATTWDVLALLAVGTHLCYLGPALLAIRIRRTVSAASLTTLGTGLVLTAVYILGLSPALGTLWSMIHCWLLRSLWSACSSVGC